jgi:peptide/nickel transport system substrate-binding protein
MSAVKRLLALAALAAITIAGCSKADTSAARGIRINPWTHPHVLTFTDASDIDSLNPMFSTELTVSYLSSMTAAFLTKWDRHNKPYPELSTEVPTMANGGVSKDGLTIAFHLRKGLKWSDGAPLDADDVVWTYHAIMNPANNAGSRSGWDLVTSVAEPNKTTVIFHLKQPYSPFIVRFFSSAGADSSILPKHLLARYPNINHVPFNALPVGAGPFMYKQWLRGQRAVLVRNPYYFRGEPKLQEVDYEVVPNRDTVFTELLSHNIDLWAQVAGLYLVRANELNGYSVLTQPVYQWGHIDFSPKQPAFQDPVVRHAMELAMDRQQMITKVQRGYAHLEEGIAPESAPYYDRDIPLVPFDLAEANRLLDGDGWMRGADGIREKHGERLDFVFVLQSRAQNLENMVELMRANWQKIGVAITVKHYSAPQLFEPYAEGGILENDKFDLALFSWTDDMIGDFSALYGCDQFPPAGQNELRWCNLKADRAMHALFGHYDQAQRNADDKIVFEALAKDRPQITLGIPDGGYIYNKDLKGWNPNALTPFDDMMNVDI